MGKAQQAVVMGVVEDMLMKDFEFESYEAVHISEGTVGPGAAATFVLRTRPGVDGLATSIRRALQTVDPSLEPFQPRFLAERVSAGMVAALAHSGGHGRDPGGGLRPGLPGPGPVGLQGGPGPGPEGGVTLTSGHPPAESHGSRGEMCGPYESGGLWKSWT